MLSISPLLRWTILVVVMVRVRCVFVACRGSAYSTPESSSGMFCCCVRVCVCACVFVFVFVYACAWVRSLAAFGNRRSRLKRRPSFAGSWDLVHVCVACGFCAMPTVGNPGNRTDVEVEARRPEAIQGPSRGAVHSNASLKQDKPTRAAKTRTRTAPTKSSPPQRPEKKNIRVVQEKGNLDDNIEEISNRIHTIVHIHKDAAVLLGHLRHPRRRLPHSLHIQPRRPKSLPPSRGHPN